MLLFIFWSVFVVYVRHGFACPPLLKGCTSLRVYFCLGFQLLDKFSFRESFVLSFLEGF